MSNVTTPAPAPEQDLVVIDKAVVKKALKRSALVVAGLGVVVVGCTFLSRHLAENDGDTTPSE